MDRSQGSRVMNFFFLQSGALGIRVSLPKPLAPHSLHPTQGPQVGNCYGSGSNPGRHCQPPLPAVGTNSTSPGRQSPGFSAQHHLFP